MWGDDGALGEGGRAQAHYVAFRPKGSCFSGWQLVQGTERAWGGSPISLALGSGFVDMTAICPS